MSNHKDKDWLEKQYVDNNKSIDDLAKMCNIDRKVIIQALNDFQIYRSYKTDKHPKRW
jgi:hypothetical protein